MAPPNKSRMRTDLQPDERLVLDARHTLGPGDRLYIDDQIVATQEHLARCLINGLVASYYRVDPDAGALQAGDVVVKRPGAQEGALVRAEPAALADAGVALGIVITPAPPGGFALVALWGLVPPTITGLGYQKGEARVSAAGRAELVGALDTNDYPLGLVDPKGWLLLRPTRRGQATVYLADEEPTPGTLVLRGSQGQAKAAWFEAGEGSAANEGLVRAAAGTVAVAFRDSDDTSNVRAMSMDKDDYLQLGSAPAQGVVLEAAEDRAAAFRFGVDRLRISSDKLAFTPEGTFLVSQDPPTNGPGGIARIVAQPGASTGGAGGALHIEAGEPGSAVDGAGAIVLDAKMGNQGQTSGQIAFAAGGAPWLTWTLDKAGGPTARAKALVPLELLGPHVRVLPDPHGEAVIRTEGKGRTRIAHGSNTLIEVDGNGIGFFGVTPIKRPTISGSCGWNPALMNLLAWLEWLGLIINGTTA